MSTALHTGIDGTAVRGCRGRESTGGMATKTQGLVARCAGNTGERGRRGNASPGDGTWGSFCWRTHSGQAAISGLNQTAAAPLAADMECAEMSL